MKMREFSVLALIVLIAGFYRLSYRDWDNGHHLHPDERFLTMVIEKMEPTCGASGCFDTTRSKWNPNNIGFDFYVYGTAPLFFIHQVSEALGLRTYSSVHLLGRTLSGLADLIVLVLIFLFLKRHRSASIALWGSGLYAGLVLPIQLSHFMIFDVYVNLFLLLSIFLMLEMSKTIGRRLVQIIGSGIFFGLACASKISAAPVGILIGGLIIISYLRHFQNPQNLQNEIRRHQVLWTPVFGTSFLIASLITFRVLQPYAFQGPGFWNIELNSRWLDSLYALNFQATPSLLFPPSIQWIQRPFWFGLSNTVAWGTGFAVGLFGFGAAIAIFYRLFRSTVKTQHRCHPFVFGAFFVLFHTIWQMFSTNPTMRYQLVIYPWLAILTVWWITTSSAFSRWQHHLLTLILIVTHAWALAFAGIYREPHTRTRASQWILENIPAAVNLMCRAGSLWTRHPLVVDSGPTDNPNETLNSISRKWRKDSPLSVWTEETLNCEEIQLLFWRIGTSINDEKDVRFTVRMNGHELLSSIPTPLATQARETVISFLNDPNSDQAQRTTSAKSDTGTALEIRHTLAKPLLISRATILHESRWDDILPLLHRKLKSHKINVLDIYYRRISLEIYNKDTPEKFVAIKHLGDQSDFIVLSSPRQWGSLGRLPELFPLTQKWYSDLLGCEDGTSIFECYSKAQSPKIGKSGFELISHFDQFPSILGLKIDDQSAEEVFTVFDHPKVMIFKKWTPEDPDDG